MHAPREGLTIAQQAGRARRRSRRHALNRVIVRILAAVCIALTVVGVAGLALGIYVDRVGQALPDLRARIEALRTRQTTLVFAADGSVIAEWRAEQDRRFLPLASIPAQVQDAVIAVEDRRFGQHPGVDVVGISRALGANAQAGHVEQGGSTIAQQLVKTLYGDEQRTLATKAREALLALQLEAKVGRPTVLEAYLNAVYFGRGAYGIQSAAQRFFGVDAGKLTLSQAATLAGAIRSPSVYSLPQSAQALSARRDDVLALMREQGYITRTQETAARAEKIAIAPANAAPAGSIAPYFVEYVRQQLVARLGADRVDRGGLRVYTTLDPGLQQAAEQAARAQLADPGDPDVALVAIRHGDGSIVAMVGGRDYRASSFNLATQGHRQPGSAFKPFVLAAALTRGYSPSDTVDGRPFSASVGHGTWDVENYEGYDPGGQVSLRDALAHSVNAVFARLILKMGPDEVPTLARSMGISSPIGTNPAIALGGLATGVTPLEMAEAYGTIANGGIHESSTAIGQVTDSLGNVLWSVRPTATQALKPEVASEVGDMMHGVIADGTGRAADIGQWAAGKTGTTQSYRDAWFVGWSGDISTAVWVGHAHSQVAMTDVHGICVTGGSFPAHIWHDFMEHVVTTSTEQ